MKSVATYLHHLPEMIDRIEAATTGGKDSFLTSRLHQDAVLGNLHTLTETTQRLSPELKAVHSEIEWKKLAAFRNVLVHDYLGIDVELVWAVVSQDFPGQPSCRLSSVRSRRSKRVHRVAQAQKVSAK